MYRRLFMDLICRSRCAASARVSKDSEWKSSRRVLNPLCTKLGIQPGGMHAFRHGRVSQLQASGVPADFTKSQVGHSSLRTTSGYTHFTDAFKRETVERLAPKLMFCTQPA